MSFHAIHSPHLPLVLGATWLCKHNPHVDWYSGNILGWGVDCLNSCLRAEASALTAAQDEGLCEVCNKSKAISLSPNGPYGYKRYKRPFTRNHPSLRKTTLSAPEWQAMQDYINDFLTAGLIRPLWILHALWSHQCLRCVPELGRWCFGRHN